jgi:protein associated with RNAse G/E
MVDIESAKNVAKMEVESLVVTEEEAKKRVKNWIAENLNKGSFSKGVVQFWREVYKQVDDV